MSRRPVYLKLGGALLTVKAGREEARPDVLAALAGEIAAWRQQADRPLVLAHGSGSFAHVAARDTGFPEHDAGGPALAAVAAAARRLDGMVVDALVARGLPAVPVPGSLLAFCRDGRVLDVRARLVTSLLEAGLLPVLYGDAAPDASLRGAIASTEPQLVALARHLPPRRIVLATDVDGVYDADPHGHGGGSIVPEITPRSWPDLGSALGGTAPGVVDVTGGMASKVAQMLALVEGDPSIEALVVSGRRPGAVAAALDGRLTSGGTRIHARG